MEVDVRAIFICNLHLNISFSDNMAVKETMIFLLAIMYPVMIAKQPAKYEGKYQYNWKIGN